MAEFFILQAPVGIRVGSAIVVQTGALPILPVAKGGVATESVTVAVQLVEAPAAKAGGLQLTVVTVGCLVTVTAAAVALEERSGEGRVGKEAAGGWAPWGWVMERAGQGWHGL